MSEEFMREMNNLRRLVWKRGYDCEWLPYKCSGATFRINGPRRQGTINSHEVDKIRDFIVFCGIELETETEAIQRILSTYD